MNIYEPGQGIAPHVDNPNAFIQHNTDRIFFIVFVGLYVVVVVVVVVAVHILRN